MGAGCGILGILAAKRYKARKIISTDINPYATFNIKINAKLNDLSRKISILLGDLFQPIRKNVKFDTILFNSPYLPSQKQESETWIEKAWAGGFDGREVIDRFLKEVPNRLKKHGRLLLVQSTMSNVEKTLKTIFNIGLQVEVIAQKKVAFETIVVIKASYL